MKSLYLISNSAAFFHGQVEQPVRGLMSLVQQKDIPVLIAINEKGIYVIDHVECVRKKLKLNNKNKDSTKVHLLFFFLIFKDSATRTKI